MFKKVLIANRGAIATRIIGTLTKMNIQSVAIYHQADISSLHVQRATEAYCLGDDTVAKTYLNVEKIINLAKACGAEAIHPGYGFLSENKQFVSSCEKAGIAFIGPTQAQIDMFGLKHKARDLACAANVPLVPGSPLLKDYEHAISFAKKTGYPIMLKSTAGGGGIGMQVCADESELQDAWTSVKRLGENYFANDGVFLEKFIGNARHIEVQVFGNGEGQVVSFGERDCSAQRRNQKVLEECPAPNLSNDIRMRLHSTAEALMASVNYRNAGTVEFIYDADDQKFYFLEVNTRLQVEHGVTEQVWGIDLVDLMVRQAAGSAPDLHAIKNKLSPKGCAVELRLYAEDTNENFRPSSGVITHLKFPTDKNLRIDHWLESGIEVSALFDPMLAKIIATGEDRAQALSTLKSCLEETKLYGIECNKEYGVALINSPECQDALILTRMLADFSYRSHSVSVIDGGTQTTVQDYPARTGYWAIGVPPSGPMDSLHFRLANALVGNSEDCAGLEITINGPTLRFNAPRTIAICGAVTEIEVDGNAIPMNTEVSINAGQTLRIARVKDAGARVYLAIEGGLDCADYLGSKSTFTLGQFGGHAGRALRATDVLHLNQIASKPVVKKVPALTAFPKLNDDWTIRVIYGPHGAPDFFTHDDITAFLDAKWEVHFNSSRTGVRLIGPKPQWARSDGGEAGLHPSNIHDNAYAFGSIDFTGDMPVILGPDGPSLGGFVCPFTVIQADLWKLGQLKAGARIQFIPVTIEQASASEKAQRQNFIEPTELTQHTENIVALDTTKQSPIYARFALDDEDVAVRLAGDHFVLIEIGPLELDVARRFKVHALMTVLKEEKIAGVIDITPGIRSLQIHYDSQLICLEDLTHKIAQGIKSLSSSSTRKVASRIVHLPLSWNDPACQQAIEKYMQSVRPDAPWCPSNLDFIRRINGLDSIEDVKKIVFDASYLVMGLGDVYLGAPVATPVDPRHRLVTTKYNPARTWTAENSVGIGGAYMCVYGMEGPGGYQFVGRTLQMWNRYKKTSEFTQPWLLRFFDQIKFYEVSDEELVTIRRDFPHGNYPIKVENVEFDLNKYEAFLSENEPSISAFQSIRKAAFDDELTLWKKTGKLTYVQKDGEKKVSTDEMPANTSRLESPVSGNVWKCLVGEGQDVEAGETIMILESMKMEFAIKASESGTLFKILVNTGQMVNAGQELAWVSKVS